MADRGPRSRLDTPRDTRRPLVRRPAYDSDTFGVFAEQFARFMGTGRFLMYMTGFVIVWVTINAVGLYVGSAIVPIASRSASVRVS